MGEIHCLRQGSQTHISERAAIKKFSPTPQAPGQQRLKKIGGRGAGNKMSANAAMWKKQSFPTSCKYVGYFWMEFGITIRKFNQDSSASGIFGSAMKSRTHTFTLKNKYNKCTTTLISGPGHYKKVCGLRVWDPCLKASNTFKYTHFKSLLPVLKPTGTLITKRSLHNSRWPWT